uniref:C2H2-type domain-containing protein n=1 Tax=Rodentolepis nana TaxID=102285 RepID=A0A0R3T3J6_RODNA
LSTNGGSSQNRQSPCESRCYYRCFGSCRQIFPSLDELRSHMKTCVYALATLKRTIGDLLFNSNIPVEPTQGQGSDIANNGKNPHCLCLFCDISTNYNVSLGKKDDSATLSSTGFPNLIPTSPSTFQPAEPFEDLKNLHDHEYTTHVAGSSLISGGNQAGCPFCREKLTLKTSDSGNGSAFELLNHLRKHAMANPFEFCVTKWSFFASNSEVVMCHCHTGLLDSPLALMAHAAALPTSANVFRGSSRIHKFGDVALLPFPSLFSSHLKNNSTRPVTAPIPMEVQLASTPTPTQTAINANEATTTNGGAIETRERNVAGVATVKFLYQPGGHPPLSKEVYEHLRFGHYFELDDRLRTFNVSLDSNDAPSSAANKVFICPICQYHGASRWALTEHAFFFHWLRLCYICCDYIYDDSACDHSSNEKSIWSHIYTCLNHRHAAILSFKSGLDESFENMGVQMHQPGKKRRHTAQETEEFATESSEIFIPPSILHPSSHTIEDRSGDLDESQFRDPSSCAVKKNANWCTRLLRFRASVYGTLTFLLLKSVKIHLNSLANAFPMQPTDVAEDDVPLAIRAQTDGLSDNAVSSRNPR